MAMAVPSPLQVTADPTTLGMPASFVFDSGIVFPGVQRPVYTGSNLGVPAVDQIAGETPSNGGSSQAAAYGQATSVKSPHQQPILWSVAMVALGVILLSHAARLNLRA